ncbi:uncharacterized protein METZ01_LOCUS141183, partial [marine metagenome]
LRLFQGQGANSHMKRPPSWHYYVDKAHTLA